MRRDAPLPGAPANPNPDPNPDPNPNPDPDPKQVVCYSLEDGSEVASRLTSSGGAVQCVHQLFDLIKCDVSGHIEIAQLRAYLAASDASGGSEIYAGCISRLFAKLDLDGDGFISREDLALAQAAHAPPHPPPHPSPNSRDVRTRTCNLTRT